MTAPGRRNIAAVERAYRRLFRGTGVVVAALGVAMVAVTLARGGGPLAYGVLIGVLFIAAGVGRAYIARDAA